jgi:hypothetical protein
MKKTVFLIAIAIMCPIAALQAQENNRITFGIRAGVNFQNFNGKDSQGDKLKNDMIVGFNTGVNVELPIAPDFFLQPGLLFSVKGTKNTEGSTTGKLTVDYIELPVNFLFKPVLGNGRLLLGFGPYIAYALAGKVKLSDSGTEVEQKIKFENNLSNSQMVDNEYYLRPFDAGANLLAGYEFGSGISFQLNVQLGLLKTNPGYEGDSEDKASAKNTGFGISAGYRF